MSLLLSESTRLAGPVESLAIEPWFVSPASSPWAAELPEIPEEPSFLLQARDLVENSPNSATAHARLAQAAVAVGLPDEARESAARAGALASEPGRLDSAATLAAAQVLLAVGALADAKGLLEAMPVDNVSRSLLLARVAITESRFGDALSLLEGVETREACNTRGWILLETRRFAEAVHTLRGLIRNYGQSAVALTNLGYAYAAMGALAKAIAVTRQAQEIDPVSPSIALNLVSYYRAIGDAKRALDEIQEQQLRRPDDLRLVFVEADIRVEGEDVNGAERALRRARTARTWAEAPLMARAELEANLTFVRWLLGRSTRVAARDELATQLRRTEFESLEIARMLTPLFRDPDEMDELEELCDALAVRHPKVAFLNLRSHLAMRRGDLQSATDIALRWAEESVFDPHAAGTAVFLLADIRGDYDRALAIGFPAVRRHPSSAPLVNNVAYTLTLAGRYNEALRLIPTDPGANVHLIATRALVDYLRGDSDAGHAGFQRAREVAEAHANTDDELPDLVTYHEVVAMYRAARLGVLKGTDPNSVHLEFPVGWQTAPALILMKAIADREGIAVTAASDGG